MGTLFSRVILVLAVALLPGLGGGQAFATSQTFNCGPDDVCSLGELFDGGSVIVDDKRFDEWELFFLDLSDPNQPVVDLDAITVTPLDDQPLNSGLKFNGNGELFVLDDNFLDLAFGFRVSTLSGLPLIKDNSLELNSFFFGGVGGAIIIGEDIFDACCDLLGTKEVFAENRLQAFELFDRADFDPQSEIFVEKFISVFGGDPGFRVELEMFTQRFSQVPEPGTLLLLGSGLAGLAMWRLRKQG